MNSVDTLECGVRRRFGFFHCTPTKAATDTSTLECGVRRRFGFFHCTPTKAATDAALQKRSCVLIVLSVWFIFWLVPAAAAEDDARALVVKGLQARGGEAKLLEATASIWKIKGTFIGTGTFTGEICSQLPSQSKVTLHFDLNGLALTQIQAMSGDRGWISIDGQVQEMDADTLAQMKESAYIDHVSLLSPLLKEKRFELSLAGEAEVAGRPARAVLVAAKGQPNVKLFFDRASNLLVRVDRHFKEPESKKSVLREAVLSGWRDADFAEIDEQLLKSHKLATDSAALLAYVRKQVLREEDRKAIGELIQQLGNDAFAVREKATRDLIARGPAAAPLLKQAQTSADLEVARRAKQCLKAINGESGQSPVAAAVRLLARRKPPGTPEALLDFLPSADPAVAKEVLGALAAVAQRDGQPEPALLKALDDKDPARRQAAGAVLGKDGGAYLAQPNRRLFIDGLRIFKKVTRTEDGKDVLQWEVLDVQFFNKLDNSVFARP